MTRARREGTDGGETRRSRPGTAAANRAAVVLSSGVALALAFPRADLAPLAWASVAPLLYVARGQSVRTGFGTGLVFGVGFFGALLAWISIVGWLAWSLLVVLQAAWIGVFAACWAILSRRGGPLRRVLTAAMLWVTVEYLRALWPLGGFTWGQLAQSQHGVETVLSAASVGGGWLVALVVVAVNACLMECALARQRVRVAPAWFMAAAVMLTAPGLLPGPAPADKKITVAIVQGNVPRRFTGSAFDKDRIILNSHARLTRELPSGIDLVVWPESSVGFDLEATPGASEVISAAARTANAPMVVGGNLDLPDDRYQVMAFLFSETGQLDDFYQKTHLVPFGEYIPGRRWLEWIPVLDQIPRDAVAGDQPVVFEIAGTQVAPVVSFEGDFGSLVRRRLELGGRVLVVCTNTSTWGESWASAQHLAFSRVRAVENGVPVVHAALSGTSAFVDADGSVKRQSPLWKATTLIHEVAVPSGVSLYTRVGDWVPLSACAYILGAAIAFFRRSRPEGSAPS